MAKGLVLSASTIMGMYAHPRLFELLPVLEPLRPVFQEKQQLLKAAIEGTTSGCSACRKRQITMQVYADLVKAFAEHFVTLYHRDPQLLHPLLDYFRVTSVELPTKTGPKLIVSRP